MTSLPPNARLALDAIMRRPTRGIPGWLLHVMQIGHIETIAGMEPGSYRRDPDAAYVAFQRAAGTCMLDQYLADNPLTMGDRGFEGAAHGATTGADEIVLDGIRIDSPEAVVEHMETVVFPGLRRKAELFDEQAVIAGVLAHESRVQALLGPDILKAPYAVIRFPLLGYGTYGYVNYFMSYALYPEVQERFFSLQADLDALHNRAVARACAEAGLPPLHRLDHDMADSRGTLVDVASLDRIWFPHFSRAIEPALNEGVNLIWHCDGNLMRMVPRLIEAGIQGFQGFQYEDGMDYERICRMKSREGRDLIIVAGVSVTRTLPRGAPEDVRRELRWLVDNGPRAGLFLGASSSIAPGVPLGNIRTLIEGLRHYREHGREG
jgi:hypothetical protein